MGHLPDIGDTPPSQKLNASDLRSFSFCRRAWYLDRTAVSSSLSPQRQHGLEDHLSHADAATKSFATNQFSVVLLLLGLIGLLTAAIFNWLAK